MLLYPWTPQSLIHATVMAKPFNLVKIMMLASRSQICATFEELSGRCNRRYEGRLRDLRSRPVVTERLLDSVEVVEAAHTVFLPLRAHPANRGPTFTTSGR